MANYAQQSHYRLNEPLRPDYEHTEFKTEPYDLATTQRHTYTYGAHHAYSEEELAESLGWVDYAQNPPNHAAPNHGMHLSAEMGMQQTPTHNRAPSTSLHHSGSIASNGTFGSVPTIPVVGQSPTTWHSSLESSHFLAEPSSSSQHHGRTPSTTTHPLTSESSKKEVSTVAEKKAMRRYSHNAVERRRRDNINEQIQELSVLVTELGASQSPRTETILNGPPNATKPNKGAVLRKSVEYIRLLKSIVQEKNERERLLEQEILRLGGTLPMRQTSDTHVSMWIDESAIAEDDD